MKIVIIGAGIAGLTAAFTLQKKHQVVVLESSNRPGGWIHSTELGGFLFERGPRGFRPEGKGKKTLALAQELGLKLISANPESKIRYLALNGELRPISPMFLLKNGGAAAFFRDLLMPKTTSEEDRSIFSFCKERYGPLFTQTFIDPLVAGIYGGDLKKLSMKSCFPNLWKHRFLTLMRKRERAPTSLYTFEGGMESMPQALASRIDLHLNTPALAIEPGRVVTPSRDFEADHVLLAAPPHLLGLSSPCSYASLTTVSLGWKKHLLTHKGFGFLVPSSEKESILGITFDSEIFSRGDKTQLCVMLRGEDPLEKALAAVEKYLKIKAEPDEVLLFEAKYAIPQYEVGYEQRVARFRAALPKGVTPLGSSYDGVGVNDCIDAAFALARVDGLKPVI